MKRPSLSISGLISVFIFVAPAMSAAQLTLVLRPGGTSWQIQEAERVTFNQKDKVRIGPSEMLDFQPDQYKRLRAIAILQAGMIRRHAGGFLVRKSANGNWEPVMPDGVKQKASSAYAEVWSSISVEFRKDQNTKGSTTVPAADLFAILPGPDSSLEVVDFLSDKSNFRGVGEKDEQAAFEERMSLLVGVAPSITGDAAPKLKQLLLAEMEAANQRLHSGIARYADLKQGLRFVPFSEQAFPDDASQRTARNALHDQQNWLDRRIAILKAMAAGAQAGDPLLWDALIEKYSDFERWDSAPEYADIRKLREMAFRESTPEHLAAAGRLRAAKQFSLALHELTIVSQRSPNDKAVAGLLDEVKAESEADRGSIKDRKPEISGSPEYRRVTHYLADADNYATSGQLEEAEQQLEQAEALAKGSPRVMFARAKLYAAQNRPLDALDVLDQYMRSVSDDKEINDGEALRSKVSLTLNANKRRIKEVIERADAAGDFLGAMKAAREGLAMDPRNLDFLLYGGKESAILRKNDQAAYLLNQYLSLSSANSAAKRAEVYNVLSLAAASPPAPDGTLSWFSAYKSPADLFYCPISLAPKPRIAEVRASRKQVAVYQWTNDQLSSIHTTSQGKGGQDLQVYFDYFGDGKGVRRVAAEPFDPTTNPPTPRLTAPGAAGPGRGVYVVLANHPVVDPIMVKHVTGKSVAVLVTGNSYFHPFVWNAIHAFLADYDDQGRVASAREIAGPDQPPHVLDFKWDGLRLIEISDQSGAYLRKMTYSGGRLTGETVSFGGKKSNIEYKYTGGQLTAARCDEDPSLDNRNCSVTFR